MGMRYGKWPHEYLLACNDPPGPIPMAHLIFDKEATMYYDEAMEEAHRKAMKR